MTWGHRAGRVSGRGGDEPRAARARRPRRFPRSAHPIHAPRLLPGALGFEVGLNATGCSLIEARTCCRIRLLLSGSGGDELERPAV